MRCQFYKQCLQKDEITTASIDNKTRKRMKFEKNQTKGNSFIVRIQAVPEMCVLPQVPDITIKQYN